MDLPSPENKKLNCYKGCEGEWPHNQILPPGGVIPLGYSQEATIQLLDRAASADAILLTIHAGILYSLTGPPRYNEGGVGITSHSIKASTLPVHLAAVILPKSPPSPSQFMAEM